ncbi:MAG TPA: glycosyltransferase, partial [Candidatus Paceibacterota bacterium]|nr:glycosyltransferase [Candidatus Paceibacterota bacterium]
MHVLLITSTASEKSGWGRLSAAAAQALREEGADVSLMTDEKERSAASFFRNCLRARKEAKRADVVHALDGWPYGVYGLAAVAGTRKKLFINGIGTYSVAPLYSFARGPLMRLAYGRASKAFCISAYTKREIEKGGVPSSKLDIVHLGTNALPPASEKEIEAVRAANHIPADAHPVILTVGAVKDRKGQF